MLNIKNTTYLKISFLLALSAGFFIGIINVQAAELFSDGFESGFGAWTEVGANWDDINNAAGAYEGSYRAQATGGNIAAGNLVKLLSTEGYEDVTLNFKYQIPTANGFEDSDKLEIAYTNDAGATWTTVHEFIDGNEIDTWTNFDLVLPTDAADTTGFGVKFLLNAPHASDMFRLDSVSILGEEIVQLDNDSDGVFNEADNCVEVSNSDQADFDGDSIGDVCDADKDNDGISNVDENEGCEFDADLNCGIVLDTDGDGVVEGDFCPNTETDEAGYLGLNPNHWRFDGVNLVKGLTKSGNSSSNIYTISDTRGCGCDQIIEIFQSYTGYAYLGHQKYGCSNDLMEDFLNFIW